MQVVDEWMCREAERTAAETREEEQKAKELTGTQ